MSSWKSHVRYGEKRGIRKEIMEFVNRIIDLPEKYLIPELEKPEIKSFLTKKFGEKMLLFLERVTEITKNWKELKEKSYRDPFEDYLLRYVYSPEAITHKKLHGDLGKRKEFIKIVKAVAEYYYGEEGIKAVEAHLELDEFSHFSKDFQLLIQNVLVRDMNFEEMVKCKRLLSDPERLIKFLESTGNLELFAKNFKRILEIIGLTVLEKSRMDKLLEIHKLLKEKKLL